MLRISIIFTVCLPGLIVWTSGLTADIQKETSGFKVDGMVNAAQFGSVQSAIDSMPKTGGTIYVPGTMTDIPGFIINKPVKVVFLGEGHTLTGSITILSPGASLIGPRMGIKSVYQDPEAVLKWAGPPNSAMVKVATEPLPHDYSYGIYIGNISLDGGGVSGVTGLYLGELHAGPAFSLFENIAISRVKVGVHLKHGTGQCHFRKFSVLNPGSIPIEDGSVGVLIAPPGNSSIACWFDDFSVQVFDRLFVITDGTAVISIANSVIEGFRTTAVDIQGGSSISFTGNYLEASGTETKKPPLLRIGDPVRKTYPNCVWIERNYLGGPGDGCAAIEGFGWSNLTIANNMTGGSNNGTFFKNTGGLPRSGGRFYANGYQGVAPATELTSTEGFDMVQLVNPDPRTWQSRSFFDDLRIRNAGALRFRDAENKTFLDAIRLNQSNVTEIAPAGGGVSIGGGTPITKHLSVQTDWSPGEIADGETAMTTVTVKGAAVGDIVVVGHTGITQAGVILSASMTSADTVAVTLLNRTGKGIDVKSGVLRVGVWKYE